jgi:hypothetical protein
MCSCCKQSLLLNSNQIAVAALPELLHAKHVASFAVGIIAASLAPAALAVMQAVSAGCGSIDPGQLLLCMLSLRVLLTRDATALTLLTGPCPDLCRPNKYVPYRRHEGRQRASMLMETLEHNVGSTVLHSTATSRVLHVSMCC